MEICVLKEWNKNEVKLFVYTILMNLKSIQIVEICFQLLFTLH